MADPLQGEVYYWPQIKKNHPMGDQKVHRWVVVSRDVFNKGSAHVLACPLTSYLPTALDIEVKKTPHNRLDHDSALLPRMISPILKDELGEPIARLSGSVTQHVLDRLRMIVEVQ
ncbi:MAG: type II toxin-antitoxin system PemK/MazF family toxin [Phycisphaerae bacterium]|nr:type II toxin-antitoxin system PemK/MazF family toxin [Phycisphaerae bacterium]